METAMTLSRSFVPSAPQYGLKSGIFIEQDPPCCDGVNHLYIPECELEILVCKPSRSYVAMAHMCPCGAVSTDRGKTWSQPMWGVMPAIVREDKPATVSEVHLDPEATIAPANIGAQRRIKLATLTSVAMLTAGFLLGIVMNFLLLGIAATIASPHVWVWTKIRAPGWWRTLVCIVRSTPAFLLTTIVSVDLMLGQTALCLKIWLKERPAAIEEWNIQVGVKLTMLYFASEDWVTQAWANRPLVLQRSYGVAFYLFILVAVLLAGIR